MLDIHWILHHREELESALKKRGVDFPLSSLYEKIGKRGKLIQEVEEIRHRRKELSERFRTSSPEEQKALKEESQSLSSLLAEKEALLKKLEEELNEELLTLPNIPHPDVLFGKSSEDNQIVREQGELPHFPFTPLPHWDIGEKSHILELKGGAEISGSRFYFLKNEGVLLELHLALFMLEHHIRKGYTPLIPPYLVKGSALVGTGQLPKFQEELFRIQNWDLYLIPTAEVPVTNIFRDTILPEEELPVKFVAFSPCFRAEAGAHGQDTRGIIRVHQFHKIELVWFEHPERSRESLETLTHDAEEILSLLSLPYRVVKLCTGDLGFASAMTYDLEVWLPGQKRWLEVSSSSLFTDFQARRLKIRYRSGGGKPRLLHTLNASGLAVGRTMVAILENYQTEEGIRIPPPLQERMGIEFIKYKR